MSSPRQDFAHIIAEKTLHLTNEHELVNEVAAYLVENNEPFDVSSVMRDIIAYRADKGYVEAVVVTASVLNAEARKDVMHLIKQEYPKARSIRLDEHVDPSVVGGVRLELPGRELDLTVKGRLGTFTRVLTDGRS